MQKVCYSYHVALGYDPAFLASSILGRLSLLALGPLNASGQYAFSLGMGMLGLGGLGRLRTNGASRRATSRLWFGPTRDVNYY